MTTSADARAVKEQRESEIIETVYRAMMRAIAEEIPREPPQSLQYQHDNQMVRENMRH